VVAGHGPVEAGPAPGAVDRRLGAHPAALGRHRLEGVHVGVEVAGHGPPERERERRRERGRGGRNGGHAPWSPTGHRPRTPFSARPARPRPPPARRPPAAPGRPPQGLQTSSVSRPWPFHSTRTAVASSCRSPAWWSRIECTRRRNVSGGELPPAEARLTRSASRSRPKNVPSGERASVTPSVKKATWSPGSSDSSASSPGEPGPTGRPALPHNVFTTLLPRSSRGGGCPARNHRKQPEARSSSASTAV